MQRAILRCAAMDGKETTAKKVFTRLFSKTDAITGLLEIMCVTFILIIILTL